ncbi:hypothetical protein, partial [Mycoplasmopsis arginini]|uniref:hypothetical protein n=1 Tax=Mycoplasmopsis arginini TaxID=2094 RepID=UPI002733429D
IKLYVPSDKNEQIKISKFIELFEKKIDTCKLKLETLKKYKKGLCDYLFIDEQNSNIHLYDLVENNPSQLLTKDIEK